MARVARQLPRSSAWRAAATILLGRFTKNGALPAPLPPQGASMGPSQDRVALFPGCVASVEDAAAQRAAATLLRAAGYEVTVLPAFCCGAMDAHAGAAASAQASAEAVREAFAGSGASQLVTATPGCLSTLRHALPERSADDVITLLAARADRLAFRALHERVALHIPCTQTNVARSDTALRTLLSRIPGLDAASLPAQPTCCGAAGTHMLDFPERAQTLRDMTLRQVTALAPSRLLSSNVGCRMHLAAGMTPETAVPDLHPLTLLADQLESP
ncbi:glycolate oxidase iron-sulfur subunit [Luteibacter sp. Sphag1AF]|uniref:(Fe-S)-binding protein n=1 Tax=Luteibacter sp. Sphag1AF TaxID=2587031 RepID=UPI0017AE7286|nr:(Fe-S)-binding protein [Luteibacter sp. Sphag1AF]MBB3227853.1 glycolate oxidase iron-sulfur subunit [Luteibacter sp. Sphag1AF]